jgi:fatty acid desaturase
MILAAIYACERFMYWALWTPIVYIVVVLFVGARQHALLILMHDATHYRLFRNRALNDWVGETLLAWPHLVTLRSYRINHFAHHRYVNSERDPDWVRKQDDPAWSFPKRASRLAAVLLGDAAGLGLIYLLRVSRLLSSRDQSVPRAFKVSRLVFYSFALALILWLGLFKAILLYWLVPYLTWLMVILRIRSIAEHFAIRGRSGIYGQIRSTHAGLLARIFVAPKNVNYHIEHHLFPSVPFFRLPRLHRLLCSKPEFRESAHLTSGYFQVLRECSETAVPQMQ